MTAFLKKILTLFAIYNSKHVYTKLPAYLYPQKTLQHRQALVWCKSNFKQIHSFIDMTQNNIFMLHSDGLPCKLKIYSAYNSNKMLQNVNLHFCNYAMSRLMLSISQIVCYHGD